MNWLSRKLRPQGSGLAQVSPSVLCPSSSDFPQTAGTLPSAYFIRSCISSGDYRVQVTEWGPSTITKISPQKGPPSCARGRGLPWGPRTSFTPPRFSSGLPCLGHVCHFWMQSTQTALQNLTLELQGI